MYCKFVGTMKALNNRNLFKLGKCFTKQTAAIKMQSNFSKYRFFLPIQTRCADNDYYSHVNNSQYHFYCDTVVNTYLIWYCGLSTDRVNTTALAYTIQTQCSYRKPLIFPQVILAGLGVKKVGRSSVHYEVLPDVLTINEAYISKDGAELRTKYGGEIVPDHITSHQVTWLRAKCYCDRCLETKIEQRDVISHHINNNNGKRKIPTMKYQEMIDDPDQGLFKLVNNLVKIGFCLVKNVPAEPGMVVKIAKQIGFIESSTYGEVSCRHTKANEVPTKSLSYWFG